MRNWERPISNLRVDELRRLREEFGLSTFVETGCFHGDGIATALSAGFDQALSCDIWPDAIAACKQRFSGSPVKLFEGDSVSCLGQILECDLGKTLFWLDAHYPGHYGLNHLETGDTKFPLLSEMSLIAQMKGHVREDVIIFDDLRVIASGDNPRWHEGEISEYYIIRDCSLADLINPFLTTHSAMVDHREEGILFLTPRREETP